MAFHLGFSNLLYFSNYIIYSYAIQLLKFSTAVGVIAEETGMAYLNHSLSSAIPKSMQHPPTPLPSIYSLRVLWEKSDINTVKLLLKMICLISIHWGKDTNRPSKFFLQLARFYWKGSSCSYLVYMGADWPDCMFYRANGRKWKLWQFTFRIECEHIWRRWSLV